MFACMPIRRQVVQAYGVCRRVTGLSPVAVPALARAPTADFMDPEVHYVNRTPNPHFAGTPFLPNKLHTAPTIRLSVAPQAIR